MKTYIVRFMMPLTRGLIRCEVEAKTAEGAKEAFALLHPAGKVYDVSLKKQEKEDDR